MLPINSGEYRSGLKLKHKGLGGHSYCVAREGVKPGEGLFAGMLHEAPTIWQCQQCHLLLPGYLLSEGFYPRPCMGMVRAIGAAA